MNRLKNILYSIIALLVIVCGIFIYQWWQSKSKVHIEKNATVLLEKIQKVAKLATVEGHFSELYQKKSFTYFDISPFQKKVLVRVQAKVAAGYDLEGLHIEFDSTNRTIWINNLPDPKILYIDHSLDYYDITEGLFTSFNAADYNQIHAEAKDLIRQKATESNLLTEAQTQGKDLMDMIGLIAIGSGWELKVRSRPELKK